MINNNESYVKLSLAEYDRLKRIDYDFEAVAASEGVIGVNRSGLRFLMKGDAFKKMIEALKEENYTEVLQLKVETQEREISRLKAIIDNSRFEADIKKRGWFK